MALSQQDKQELLNAIKAESQSMDELTTVTSLDGIVSLPAMKGNQIVNAPISLLRKPAEDAAAVANNAASSANTAAGNANAATESANAASANALSAAGSANEAAVNAEEATRAAENVVSNHEDTAVAARNGATARFGEINGVDSSRVTAGMCDTEGGVITYSTNLKRFLYLYNMEYYIEWSGRTGIPMEMYMHNDSIRKDKVYILGETMYVWSDEKEDLVVASGSGSGSGFYNVTANHPLQSGYYTLTTAVSALEDADIDDEAKPGMIITFEVSSGAWEEYRFCGTSLDSFLDEVSWEEYGGGRIKSISLNGQNIAPDVDGNVSIAFDQISVDESLNAESTNPVQNAVVTAEINQLKASLVGGVEIIEGEDKNTLNILGVTGEPIASAEFSGGGGGGGTSTASRIIVTASLDKTQVKEGGAAMLTYTYNHVNADGESDGIKANITITIQRGTTQTFQQTYNNVSAGTFTLDISAYLLAGTVDVYVRAVAVTAEGTQQTKQAYTSISVVTLLLSSSYNLGSTIANGGYKNNDTIEIPFTITGSGTKDVSMYIDGSDTPTTQTINKSGTVNGSFTIQGSSLTAGRHTVQLVAERNGLLSDSIYIDILKAGLNSPFVGIKYSNKNGTILFSDHLTPTLVIGQYEEMNFDYIAYDPNTTPASVQELHDGNAIRTLSVPRSMQTYTNRFTAQGLVQAQFVCRTATYNFNVDVTESNVAVGEATQGLVLRLVAAGRSNDEENPAVWEYGNVKTYFENVDWKSSGWTGDALRLRNGAKAVIDYKAFETDIAKDGCTIEMEFMISNVVDRNANVITCLSGSKGFQVTAEEASMYTGSTKEVEDDDGNKVVTNVGVGSKFASDMLLKVAFVIGKRNDGRLIELYVNGIRSKADIYAEGDDFEQKPAQNITIDSSYADIDTRIVRVYNRAITDDEELGNYIVDRPTSGEMSDLFLSNDVLDDEEGTDVSIDKLIAKGKGVLLFVRTGGLDPVNAENNKDTDFLSDVYFYSPFGKEYDFVLYNCYIRIQGTSSTKYPRKNYRIYFAKGTNPTLFINGIEQTAVDSKGKRKNKYPMRPGSIPMNLFCMKCDFSDSSMTHNTGGAKLFNSLFKELGLLTPAQELDGDIRASIDGFPIDIFAAETIDSAPEYYGQYNFNNEKSNSGPLFGMEGVDGGEFDCPITFEFLNNTQKLCLFQVEEDLDAQLEREFDDAWEFNYPKDLFWTQAKATKKEGAVCSEEHKKAVKDLLTWIRDCIPAGADLTNYTDIASFESPKFKNEISQHFNVNYLLTYYLFTDYFALVDQRAKNMLMRTWDGNVWYITYYDGDTALLGRNDSFLAYLYTLNRETWDSEKSKYAFEGHNSWLWCLVLANLDDELKACANSLREKLTVERALAMFNDEQAGNWSERQYNKSGYFKYIIPQIVGVDVKGTPTKYPYIYALQGSREAHRTHTIVNRFALLDAKYETGSYRSDNIDMYMSREETEAPNTIVITSNDDYYFGYGTNNAQSLQPSQGAKEGETVTLTISNAFTMNDPIRVYGATRMRELDMRGSADNLTGDLNLNKCTVLQKLDISTNGEGSLGWCVVLDKCTQLRDVNLNGQRGARTGTLSSTELNFRNQTKLERLDAGGVEVQGVIFAEGAPIVYAYLPETIKTLRLEYLPLLTSEGLIIDDYSNIETFRFASCPHLNWEALLSRCSNVKRIRVTGIDMEGDGSLLERYLTKGGIDADGNATNTCGFVGRYRLTRYIDDSTYETYCAHYPELNIIQPQYTMIEFDDNIADEANVSNLDNSTGSKFGTDYVPSGHIVAIRNRRFRCLAKVTTRPTSRAVTQAGQSVSVNNGDGVATIYPLHNENSYYYADAENIKNCTAALLDGSRGDVMMYEPHYWKKGINDILKGKKYACYSINDEMPDTPTNVKVVLFDEIKLDGYRTGYKLLSGKGTLSASYSADSNYSVCKVSVSGYKKVRFPTVLGTNLMCSVFTDASGNIVDTIVVGTVGAIFENGMYIIYDVPKNAESLYFTISNAVDFDKVVLSNSDRIEDMEPDWVENHAYLHGVFGTSVAGTKLKSCITGNSTVASYTWTDFHFYSQQRGMQQTDWNMHNDIANLFYAFYGRRDSQAQCGAGYNTNARTTGATAVIGMQDTVNTDGTTVGGVEGNGLAFYKSTSVDGSVIYTRINSTNCLGYEDIYGHKYGMMDGVEVNRDTANGVWTITQPDGSERRVKGSTSSDVWISGVVFGKYMDMMMAGSVSASQSTKYCDKYYMNNSKARVVYRGSNYAHANGGVSFAYANNDASYASTYIGSRLAFRGKIEVAPSVSAYESARAFDE